MKIFNGTLLLLFLAVSVQAQDLSLYRDAETMLYSGEVIWNGQYESLQPNPPLDIEHKPAGLTDQEFEDWVSKFDGPRSQTFQIRCIFKGDYLRFEVYSEAGDVLPVLCDRVITYNGVSVTFIDRDLKNVFREAWGKPYREHHFATMYPPPRACGYDVRQLMAMAKRVKDVNSDTPEISKFYGGSTEDAIRVVGTFPDSGSTTLTEFVPDANYVQVFSTIKYINPGFRDRVIINNENLTEYVDGIVFPNKTIVSRFSGGDLEDLSNSPQIDRMTLTVQEASFNGEHSDELFNPACPADYTDLLDMRWKRYLHLNSN